MNNYNFFTKCNLLHNEKYDYSKSVYKNNRTKIIIICPEHGEFLQTPNSHLQGHGCKKCGYSRFNTTLNTRKELFLAKAISIHGDIYDYSNIDFVNSTTKIEIICNTHGPFSQTPDSHSRGHGCPKCAKHSTTNEFIEKSKLIHGEKYTYYYSDYINNVNKILIFCKTHGEFAQSPRDHLKGSNCPKCAKSFLKKSKPETELSNYIESLLSDSVVDFNNISILNGLELDIVANDNLAIEFNGNYWHSELQGKDKNYHLNKTKKCEDQNIQLLHIFEDEWIEKSTIWKSIINSKLNKSNKIYARKCRIEEVIPKDKNKFLNYNHLQGRDRSNVNLGLYYEDELVSIMTFCKSRFNKQYEWELSRFASKLNTTVVGGASKLLSAFKKTYNPNSIITYANRRYSNGNLYKQLGFTFSHYSNPNYFYRKNTITRYSRHQFQKHKLKDKLDIFDSKLSEWENMKLNGYDRIWDCGNGVWILD